MPKSTTTRIKLGLKTLPAKWSPNLLGNSKTGAYSARRRYWRGDDGSCMKEWFIGKLLRGVLKVIIYSYFYRVLLVLIILRNERNDVPYSFSYLFCFRYSGCASYWCTFVNTRKGPKIYICYCGKCLINSVLLILGTYKYILSSLLSFLNIKYIL